MATVVSNEMVRGVFDYAPAAFHLPREEAAQGSAPKTKKMGGKKVNNIDVLVIVSAFTLGLGLGLSRNKSPEPTAYTLTRSEDGHVVEVYKVNKKLLGITQTPRGLIEITEDEK